MNRDIILEVDGLQTGYGSMTVVHGICLKAFAGEIVSVVGRNGAGKTTALSAIAGLRYGPTRGTVRLHGEDISQLHASAIMGRGLAHVPEGHRIFRSMTVLENLKLGAYSRRKQPAKDLQASLEWVYELFPVLKKYAQRNAGLCSGGEQQMVAIGQALMAKPKLLSLDEPTSGLATLVINDIWSVLHQLKGQGMSIVIVEQSLERALAHSDRCYVIDNGRAVLSGTTAELAANKQAHAIIRGIHDGRSVEDTNAAGVRA